MLTKAARIIFGALMLVLAACAPAAMPTLEPKEPPTVTNAASQNNAVVTRSVPPTVTPAPPGTVVVEPTNRPLPTRAPTHDTNVFVPPPQTYNLRDVAITLERTLCFGTCPAYQVTIRGDGTVSYNGERFVRVSGTQTKKIAQTEVVELLREFYKMDFFALRDAYENGRDIVVSPDGQVEEQMMIVTDLPSLYITLHLGDFTKRVHVYFGAPDALDALGRKIDKVAGTDDWVK